MHHRRNTQDTEARAAARRALQQAYDWRDQPAAESRDADEPLYGFETAVPYRACPATPKSAAATAG